MGHQVNFYLNPEDTSAIEAGIKTLGPMLVLHSTSSVSQPGVSESLSPEEDGRRSLCFFLTRPEDLDAVVTSDVPAQGYWTVEVLNSPVIEVTGCFFDGVILRRGRLYYADGFYDKSGNWLYKTDGFRRWAKAVLAKTKRMLKRRDDGNYVGSGAEAWRSSRGGTFVT